MFQHKFSMLWPTKIQSLIILANFEQNQGDSSCIFQRFTWIKMSESVTYDLFVEDIEVIMDNSDLYDII
jgi:hypothetical protein